jgi:predicted transcriptional regulator
MELDKFLNKTDIQLYRGILRKIYKDFDNMEPEILGNLMDKLKELHQHLDLIVQQRKTKSMYDKRFFQHTGEIHERKRELNECVKTDTLLLKDIYRLIRKKKKKDVISM